MGHFVAACRRRVVYRFAQGAGKRFLRWTGPLGRRVRKFDGPLGRGLWWRLRRSLKKERGSAAGCVEGLCSLPLRGRQP